MKMFVFPARLPSTESWMRYVVNTKKIPVILLIYLAACLIAFLALTVGALIAAGWLFVYLMLADAMSPTVLPGDSVAVERFTFCFSEPKYGDIVASRVASYLCRSMETGLLPKNNRRARRFVGG